ncbi:MAG: hypothetical protein ACTHOH_06800 [Lysobacteraceae bacterium]
MTVTVTDAVGWAASAILLTTLIAQVHKQWKSGDTQGISRWLFTGQIAASVGFVCYSALVGNAVFVFTNASILLTALVGQGVYRLNRRRRGKGTGERSA